MHKRIVLAAAALALIGPVSLAEEKGKDLPPAGTTFYLSAAYPKYVTADIEFRDPSGAKWPVFVYGKPADGGTFVYDPARPKASFSLVSDQMCQNRGDQGRRILGETVSDEKPPVITFTVKRIGPVRSETIEETDSKGRKRTRQEEFCDADAELLIGRHATAVKARLTFRLPGVHQKETAYLTATFQTTGRDLGLKAEGATGPIDVRASVSAYPTKEPPPKKV